MGNCALNVSQSKVAHQEFKKTERQNHHQYISHDYWEEKSKKVIFMALNAIIWTRALTEKHCLFQ